MRRMLKTEWSAGLEASLTHSGEDSGAERTEAVMSLLSRLDIHERHVVVLRVLDGYSVRETSRWLSVREGTVRSRFSRAMSSLRSSARPPPARKNGKKQESRNGSAVPDAQ